MKKWGSVLILFTQTLILTALTLLCVVPFSCRVSEEGVAFVGGDYMAPVLEDVNVLDEKTVKINFSEKIRMVNFVVSEQIKDISDSFEHSETEELSPALKAAAGGYGRVESECSLSEDSCVLTFSALDHFEVGKAYEIFGTVEDKAGNTLTFCVPFCGFNSCVPKLVMTEVQPKYKKYKENVYRCEFVELLALTDGNLSGIELISAADGEAKKYVFPALEIKAGEVFIVHLRSSGNGCHNETEDLNASSAPHSGKNVRDIWASNDKARLSDNSDIIVLRNNINGKLLDAVMYAAEDATEWGKGMTSLAEEVCESGIYESADVSEAEINSGIGSSAQKSFCRMDAKELQARALAGKFSDGTAEYPVKRTADNWAIQNVSPGTL